MRIVSTKLRLFQSVNKRTCLAQNPHYFQLQLFSLIKAINPEREKQKPEQRSTIIPHPIVYFIYYYYY